MKNQGRMPRRSFKKAPAIPSDSNIHKAILEALAEANSASGDLGHGCTGFSLSPTTGNLFIHYDNPDFDINADDEEQPMEVYVEVQLIRRDSIE